MSKERKASLVKIAIAIVTVVALCLVFIVIANKSKSVSETNDTSDFENEEVMSTIYELMGSGLDVNYDVDIQGNTYVINMWVDSVTEKFLLENIDSLKNIDSSNESSTHNEEDDMYITIPSYSWDDIKDDFNEGSRTILDKAKSEGLKNAHVRLNLVDDSNHKNVLVTSYDGKTDFDVTELTEKERTIRRNMRNFSFKYFSHSE